MTEADEFKKKLKRFLDNEGCSSYLMAATFKGEELVLGEGDDKTLVFFSWKLAETLRRKFGLL